MILRTRNASGICRRPLTGPIAMFSTIALIIVTGGSCGTPKTSLRRLAPSDTIIYLETPDLGRMLRSVAENSAGPGRSAGGADLSILDGIQVAVAVSGFESSESPAGNDQAVLNLKPHFTLIAETHAWSWQVDSLVRNGLTEFIKGVYGPDARFRTSFRNGVERFEWEASDGRKTFATIVGSRVYFGNDEPSLERSLAVSEGKEESLLSNMRVSAQYPDPENVLAYGFVTGEGIRQISGIDGVTLALKDPGGGPKGVISGVFSQFVNKTVEELVWSARGTESGVEDDLLIRLRPDVANIFSKTVVPGQKADRDLLKFVPAGAPSVTRYNLRDPRIAFRSLLLVGADNIDRRSSLLLPSVWNSVLGPYGVSDAEGFLSEVGPYIVTVRSGTDEGFAIVSAPDFRKLIKYLEGTINPDTPVVKRSGASIWDLTETGLALAKVGNYVVLGSKKSVVRSVEDANRRICGSGPCDNDIAARPEFCALLRPEGVSVTVFDESESVLKIGNLFRPGQDLGRSKHSLAVTETTFVREGVRRKYTSAAGFIGTIVEQFDQSQ